MSARKTKLDFSTVVIFASYCISVIIMGSWARKKTKTISVNKNTLSKFEMTGMEMGGRSWVAAAKIYFKNV